MLSNKFFYTNVLNLIKIRMVIISHSVMPGASNLASLIFSTSFFHFWHVVADNRTKSGSCNGLQYSCSGPILLHSNYKSSLRKFSLLEEK